MLNQENRPPEVVVVAKEVKGPWPSPPRPTATSYPVRNTFIHYGTPLRGTTSRTLASPRTVPPNFAPEDGGVLEFAPHLPEWPPAPGHSPVVAVATTPCSMLTSEWTAVDRQLAPPLGVPGSSCQAQLQPRGAGIAPLRLFDFLPSPKVPVQHSGPPQEPPQALPPMPFGGGCQVPCATWGCPQPQLAPMWHHMPPPQPPMQYQQAPPEAYPAAAAWGQPWPPACDYNYCGGASTAAPMCPPSMPMTVAPPVPTPPAPPVAPPVLAPGAYLLSQGGPPPPPVMAGQYTMGMTYPGGH